MHHRCYKLGFLSVCSEIVNQIEQYKVLNLYQICQLLKVEGIFINEARNFIAGLAELIR